LSSTKPPLTFEQSEEGAREVSRKGKERRRVLRDERGRRVKEECEKRARNEGERREERRSTLKQEKRCDEVM
jgi:hypothetical protein